MLLWLLAHYIFCSIFVRSAMCGQVCSKEVGIGHASTNPLRCFETVLYGQQRSIAAVIKWNVYGGTIYFLTPVFGICLSLFMFVSWLAQMINHVYIHFICVFVLTMFILFLSGRHAGTAQNTCFFQQPRNEISNIFVKLISCSQNLTDTEITRSGFLAWPSWPCYFMLFWCFRMGKLVCPGPNAHE